jgi:hypothetical protein
MSAIFEELTGDWTCLDTLARRAYKLVDGAEISRAQIGSASRAAHRLEEQGWAEISRHPLASAGTGRNGKPLGPKYLHTRLTGAGQRQQAAVLRQKALTVLREQATRNWKAAHGGRGTPPAFTEAGDLIEFLDVPLAAQLITRMQQFQGLYEDQAKEEITHPESGQRINLWDLKALYARRHLLSQRDAVMIEVDLYHDQAPQNPRLKGALARLLKARSGSVPGGCEKTFQSRASLN